MFRRLGAIGPWKLSSTTVALFLLFPPLPLGLRTFDLSIMAMLGLLILFLNRKIRFGRLDILMVFLATTILGTIFSVFEGEIFSLFQFFRGIVFPILTLWIIQASINSELFKELDRILPVIIFGAIANFLMYFILGSNLYNSTLDIPYENSVYKRLFIYPTYFFLILFIDAVSRSSWVQLIYALLLAASGSKAIYLSLVLVYLYFFIRNFSFKKLHYFIGIFGLISAAAFFGGLMNRIEDLTIDGDPWRIYEPLAAMTRLSDFVRFFIGNGAGIPYWDGWAFSTLGSNEELSRVIINSSFDVHNGIMTLALRFGTPLALLFLLILLRKIPKFSGRWILCIVILLNIFLSHGPVQTVEAVGLAMGIRYLSYKSLREMNDTVSLKISSRRGL